jgi:serine/threonine protein kinase
MSRNEMCDSDRYGKVALVGKGTYSNVYSLRDDSLVMKCMSVTCPGYVCSSTLWDIVIPTTLRHRNIAKVEKIFFTPEEVQIIMPKYEPVQELTLVIMFKLIHALKYMHDNNVIHRDLKKDNIMMDRGEPVIIDFSISRVGKKDVMFPSAYTDGCRHKSVLTGRYGYEADVYALGMTFLSILLNYSQSGLCSLWPSTMNARLSTKGDLGRLVKTMIDPDNIPSLDSLLSDKAFSNMTTPIHYPPVYRRRRTMDSNEKARVGISLSIYDVTDATERSIAMDLFSQSEYLANRKREVIDILMTICDDEHQYDLSIDTLSVLAEGLYIHSP